jgi:hypothetical protein
MNATELDMAVHHRLIRDLIEHGRSPTNAELARALGLNVPEIEQSLHRLAQSHSLVLHPDRCEPWVVHPFSLSPTHTWVASGARGWWAPCLWCALGVCVLVGGEVVIHARIGGEAEAVEIHVANGIPAESRLFAHFPEPPRLAWGNVHHFCARLLPFHDRAEVAAWCERHRFPLGQVLPLTQLAELARAWYGRHAQPDWRKVNLVEAAAIFRSVDLIGEFWRLDSGDATY